MWDKIKHIIRLAPSKATAMSRFYELYQTTITKVNTNANILHQSFVVLDTETTGLNVKEDNILSIGAVRVVKNSISIADSLSIIVKNQQSPTEEAVSIHGIVQADIRGQSELDAISEFFHFIGSDILVGHHIDFDIAMLNKLSKKQGGGDIKNQIIDTSFLARRLDHVSDPNSLNRKEYTLDKLCSRYNVVPKARHTADGDAYITAMIFMKIIQCLSAKGVKTVGELIR